MRELLSIKHKLSSEVSFEIQLNTVTRRYIYIYVITTILSDITYTCKYIYFRNS